MQEQIAGLMGGRAAEELIFGQQSSGASNDFQQATQLHVQWWPNTGWAIN